MKKLFSRVSLEFRPVLKSGRDWVRPVWHRTLYLNYLMLRGLTGKIPWGKKTGFTHILADVDSEQN